jgi:hypothetical protein
MEQVLGRFRLSSVSGEVEAHLAGNLLEGASVNETEEEDEHIGAWVTQRS